MVVLLALLGSSWCCSASWAPSAAAAAAQVRFCAPDRGLFLDLVAWSSERPSRRRSRFVCLGLLFRRGGLLQTRRRRRIPLAGWVRGAVALVEVVTVFVLLVPELKPPPGFVLCGSAVGLVGVDSCRSSGAARLGFLGLTGEAVVMVKLWDFVPRIRPCSFGAFSDAGGNPVDSVLEKAFFDLLRASSAVASILVRRSLWPVASRLPGRLLQQRWPGIRGAKTAARPELVSAFVAAAWWSLDLFVIFFTFEVLCTTVVA